MRDKMDKVDITKNQTQDYEKSLSSIIKRVEESKHKAITAVNKLLIELYWFIGETIVTLQEQSKWGDGVVEKLSRDLRMKYPEMNGLSSRNLWDCKRFYLAYKDCLKLRPLVAEISKNLSFVGEEYPLVVDGEEFRIDLLFFHRELKCLVPVELKIGNFKPEYVGKMQFYLGALDELIKLPDENPSIGLILCRSKKESVVRLTLGKTDKPVKISVYETKLPDKKLIQQRLEQIKLPEKLLIGNSQNKEERR